LTRHIYVEGGGSRLADTLLREGFKCLANRHFGRDCKELRFIPSGNRSNTLENFYMKNIAGHSSKLALVDSDAPVPAEQSAAKFLHTQPDCQVHATNQSNLFLMVQVMETWLVADREALAEFYGQHFRVGNLPQHAHLEAVPKDDVLRCLNHATRDTSKGPYHKVEHGLRLIARVDPAKLRAKCPRAEIFFKGLNDEI